MGQLVPLGPERDAIGHWELGGSDASLTDLLDGAVLTAHGTAPTFEDNCVVTAGGGQHGLDTPFNEALDQTMIIVAQRPPLASKQVVMGTLIGAPGESGSYWESANTLNQLTRGYTNTLFSAGLPAPGEWYFLAVSQSGTTRTVWMSGQDPVVTAGTPILSTRKLALGCSYFSSLYGASLKAATLIVYDKVLTVDDIPSRFSRCRQRSLARGITIGQ